MDRIRVGGKQEGYSGWVEGDTWSTRTLDSTDSKSHRFLIFTISFF